MGISDMSLKQIADECGVNLGMFHYHFKTKPAFVRRVLESINEDIQKEIEEKILEGNNPLERLRAVMIAIALRILAQRKVLVSMLHDLLNHDGEVTKFVLGVGEKRLAILRPLVEECQRAGQIARLPFPQIASFISGSVNFPILVSEIVERSPNKRFKFSARVKEDLLSKKAVIQRVDLALKAISQRGATDQ